MGVPRQLGYKNVKFITRLAVTDDLRKFGKGLVRRFLKVDMRGLRGSDAKWASDAVYPARRDPRDTIKPPIQRLAAGTASALRNECAAAWRCVLELPAPGP